MDYLEKIQQLFQCTLNDIEERVKLVTVEFSVCPSDLPPYEGLLSLLTSFPERDNVKFFFRDDGGSNYTIVSHGEQNKEEYERLKTGIFEEDPVHISIEINKQVVDNRLSIYSFDRFCEDLLSLTVTEALKAFVDLYAEAEHLYFKVYGNELFYKTGTMAFASADHTIAWGCLTEMRDLKGVERPRASIINQPTRCCRRTFMPKLILMEIH